jgi:NhaP-type Na+/H+ and K+/H+ antiporter
MLCVLCFTIISFSRRAEIHGVSYICYVFCVVLCASLLLSSQEVIRSFELVTYVMFCVVFCASQLLASQEGLRSMELVTYVMCFVLCFVLHNY